MATTNTKPIRLNGEREGTNVYLYKGYLYHEDCRNPLILRCKKRISKRCGATLYLDEEGNVIQEEYPEFNGHCCGRAKHNYKRIYECKQELLRRAGETFVDITKIFKDVTEGP